MNQAIENIVTGNYFQCIQITLSGDKKRYDLVLIQKKKNELNVLDTFTTFEVDKLKDGLSKSRPVLLTLMGTGILSKKIPKTDNYRSKILFNADPEDFYWFEVEEKEVIFSSVVRKDIVHKEMNWFKENNFAIINVSFGPFTVISIAGLFSKNTILVEDFNLEFDQDSLLSFDRLDQAEKKIYDFIDVKVSNHNISAFGGLINYLFPNHNNISPGVLLSSEKEEFFYRKIFSVLGISAMLFFLGSLLISYLLLSYYQGRYQEVQVELGQQNIAYSKLVSLESDKENKESILKQSGLRDNRFLSFYLTEITKEVPSTISFTSLQIFPVSSKVKPNKRITFNNDLIEIEGKAISYIELSSWVKSMEKYDWVETIEITDLVRNGDNNDFKIIIKLKFDV